MTYADAIQASGQILMMGHVGFRVESTPGQILSRFFQYRVPAESGVGPMTSNSFCSGHPSEDEECLDEFVRNFEHESFDIMNVVTRWAQEKASSDLVSGLLRRDRLNLLEVCAGPESKISEFVAQKGGTAVRLGLRICFVVQERIRGCAPSEPHTQTSTACFQSSMWCFLDLTDWTPARTRTAHQIQGGMQTGQEYLQEYRCAR